MKYLLLSELDSVGPSIGIVRLSPVVHFLFPRATLPKAELDPISLYFSYQNLRSAVDVVRERMLP